MHLVLTSACVFFQAEGGIRDTSVTGVQTCALPISDRESPRTVGPDDADAGQRQSGTRCRVAPGGEDSRCQARDPGRGQEQIGRRRVGKECRDRRSAYDKEKKRRAVKREEGNCNRKE